MILTLLRVMAIAMLPVVELRGAIPYGIAHGAAPVWVALAAIAGNMLPIPFLIVYTRKVFIWLRRFPKAGRIVTWLENRAHAKSAAIHKYGFWGLCILVAIPLPGTGAWTGALVATVLDMRLKAAMPAISLGVLIASIVMIVPSIGLLG